jgi:multidrug efflux pump subunit AcrA (membrane-fusion protein)
VTTTTTDCPVAEGRAVTVVLPDGTEVAGTVAAVGSVAREAEGSDASPAGSGTSAGATVRVTVSVGTAEVAAYDQAPVTVRVVSAERPEVLTVPVAALLAVPGGGYAVEVVTDSGTEVVPVTTGLFADGRVEVSGDGIAEGTRVGVPSR